MCHAYKRHHAAASAQKSMHNQTGRQIAASISTDFWPEVVSKPEYVQSWVWLSTSVCLFVHPFSAVYTWYASVVIMYNLPSV